MKGSLGAAVTNTTIAGNLISGNKDGGVSMGSGGQIQNNLIGTQRDGTSALGNGNFGGIVLQGTDTVAVGGSVLAGEGNTIAFNTGAGVAVQTGTTNSKEILGNSIHSNDLLGIGLTNGASTPLANDPGDADSTSGVGNRGQNYPVITSAPLSGVTATVSGTLNSTPSTTFRVEFFANTACNAADPKDFGEGQTFIGSTSVTTDASGNASFGPLPFTAPAGQSVITSTATNNATNDTSEFSKCLNATAAANTAPVAVNDSYSTNQNQALTVPAPGVLSNDTDPDGNTLTASPVSGPANGTVTLNPDGSFMYTPNNGFSGTDSFPYKANDGMADSNNATVTITVNASNTPPPPPPPPDNVQPPPDNVQPPPNNVQPPAQHKKAKGKKCKKNHGQGDGGRCNNKGKKGGDGRGGKGDGGPRKH